MLKYLTHQTDLSLYWHQEVMSYHSHIHITPYPSEAILWLYDIHTAKLFLTTQMEAAAAATVSTVTHLDGVT